MRRGSTGGDQTRVCPDRRRVFLTGTAKEEVIFPPIAEYIKRRRDSVCKGAPGYIGELYEMMSNHAEEVYTFLKIRGASSKILDYLRNTWMAGFCTVWNLHMVTTVKSIAPLNDKETRKK